MTAPTCTVLVNGVRVADTANEYKADEPTALTGLQISWGRETMVDQPQTSSCGFTVRERPGKRSIYDLLHVGYRVDVEVGEGEEDFDPNDNIVVDPNFTQGIAVRARRGTQSNATLWRGFPFTQPDGTNQFPIKARLDGRTLPASYEVDGILIPPAPFSTVPTAWDGIPQIGPDTEWRITFDVAAFWGGGRFAGANVDFPPIQVQAVIFQSPSATGAYSYFGPRVDVPPSEGHSETVDLNVSFGSGQPSGGWLGLAFWPRARITWETVAPSDTPWNQLVGMMWEHDATQTGLAGVPGTEVDNAGIYNLRIVATAGHVTRLYLVFSGRITDLEIKGGSSWSSEWTVTAADLTADMANDNIGDEPWPAETIQQRVNRIRSVASVPFTYDMDTFARNKQITWVDVDSQPVMNLLTDLATSGDVVLWNAFSTVRGFYLRFEDTAQRASLGTLIYDATRGLVVIDYTGDFRPGRAALSACDIARDAPSFVQNVTDVLTRVDATWQEQTLNDDGLPEPTERYVHVYDAQSESLYGVRSASVSTQLTSQANCLAVATRVLTRQSDLRWRTTSFEWDTDLRPFHEQDHETAMRLLDGTTRNGMVLTITDLPEWSPDYPSVNLYVEGGSYTFDRGAWTLSLNLSPSASIGKSVRWNQLDPAWRWNQFDPAIEWWDLFGVAGPLTPLDAISPSITERTVKAASCQG